MLGGIALGAAVGLAAVKAVSNRTHACTPKGMIDWERVRQLAVAMNRGDALTASERLRLDAEYRALVAEVQPEVVAFTGLQATDAADRTRVVDRFDLVHANLAMFADMFRPLEAIAASGDDAPATALLAGVNRTVLSGEIGVLVGYLARRVLGQYDLALLGKEPIDTGKLLFVEPNIREAELTLGVPPTEFRWWLALHEVTHVVEFEGVTWLRPYFNGLLEEYMAHLQKDFEALRAGLPGVRRMVDRIRSQHREGVDWVEAMMTPEQRDLVHRLQAAMCMVEGYSNYVMNGVGRKTLPSYARITAAFARRHREKSSAERLFIRVTGLEMKMEQYRLGEAFIEAVAAAHGHAAVQRIWDAPESLPTMAEILEPEQWLQRIGYGALAAEA